jgi:hypothetical protein
MIGVANSKGVGQRVVERNIASDQMGHRGRSFIRHPLVVFTQVPGRVRGCPVMCQILNKLQSQIGGSWMERQQITIVVRLVPNRVAIGQVNYSIITKSAHAAQRTVVVIKRAVLLHHNNDVLHIINRAGLVVGGNRQRPGNAGRESCRKRTCG